MQATNREKGRTNVKRAENEAITSDMKRCAERIWNAISKYVTVDNEAIFKDKNWPYY
jgi:hypothetical protein